MLKQWEKPERPSDEKLEGRLKDARMKLQEQQLKVKEHGLPVLVLVEGWGTHQIIMNNLSVDTSMC